MANKQLRTASDGEQQMADGSPPTIHPQVFQQTVNQAEMAISITDVHGNILYVNAAFSRVTGYASDEAIGKNQSMLATEAMPRELYQSLWRTISHGSSRGGHRISGSTRRGHRRRMPGGSGIRGGDRGAFSRDSERRGGLLSGARKR